MRADQNMLMSCIRSEEKEYIFTTNFSGSLQILALQYLKHVVIKKRMEEKIEKLFSFFRKMKNQPFYTSIISQIIQIYEGCPQSLKFILYNLNQLIFTDTKQIKLRLKHRQICASIVAKLNNIYVQRIKSIIENNKNIDLQNFQLETENDEELEDSFKKLASGPYWKDLQLFKVIQEEEILLSTEKGSKVIGVKSMEDVNSEAKIFQQYINMKQATMINIEDLFKDVKSDKLNTQEAYERNKTKYEKKVEKIKFKKQSYAQESVEITISNPFNLLYHICIENILNSEWELRHLAVLILKQLIQYPQFLGFQTKVTLTSKNYTPEQRFEAIQSQTREALDLYLKDAANKELIFNKIIILSLKLLCLDRFADYQADESNIIVRNKAAQILAKCYSNLPQGDQLILLKKLKLIFSKQCKIGNQKDKFTWQVKHSFMAFINMITQYPENHLHVYKFLQENMIKMLITQQQIDQIVLAICKCFKKFIGQKFFGKAEIQRVNEQVWKIVKHLDDISVSTVSALQLLGSMFPYYNLNVCNSLIEIRKFFISKIPEVRKEFYHLLYLLYQKKFQVTSEREKKLIESNIVLFMQAAVVEHDIEIFETLKKLSPNIFIHIRKEKKIFAVVMFIIKVVLLEQYTDKLIEEKFEIFDTFNLDLNDYMYIYEMEKSHITVDKYIDKRIWKFAEIIASGFSESYEGFVQLVTEIERQSGNTYRSKLFILHLMVRLVDKYGKQAYFVQYLNKVKEMMKLEFCVVNDSIIDRIKNYAQQILKQLSEKSSVFKEKSKGIPQKFQAISDISNLHCFLVQETENKDYDEWAKEKIQIELDAVTALIEHQRTLFKQLKILSTCYYVKKEGFSNQTINNIVSAIKEALQEDKYCFLSEYGAQTLEGLSLALGDRKSMYLKIIGSVLHHISVKYEKKDMKIDEEENGYNLKAAYMLGINKYIQSFGSKVRDWLPTFKSSFIMDFSFEQGKTDPALFLVSGTIRSILKICEIDFLQQLLNKIDESIETTGNILKGKNRELFYKILEQSFIFMCENYDEKANIFFEWYLKKLKAGCTIFLECLMKLGEQSIFRISGVCSIFVLEIVKQISSDQNKQIAILCLSNVVVGVYMNNKTYPFSNLLNEVADSGVEFVKNFKDASNFEYQLKVQLQQEISLREYQMEGIQWLGFLCKFNLNGALCDDMGLGKTLQIFCLIQNEYKKMIEERQDVQPSLIIVPTTLTEHWAFEYSKYFVNPQCRTVIISNKSKPSQIKPFHKKPVIYITSYQIIEKRIENFLNAHFKFIVLDQGHIIKNPKTHKFLAVKRLQGLHRFILTGTPIQNRLKQLWSLFDFLMPGYLYTKETFKNHYQKLFEVNLTTFKEDELLFTQEQKRILQKLHLKVMPFIMRRMKSDVLKELPEKIINDYYCEMSEMQINLYKEFEEDDHHITKGKNEDNILASLSKMRKILNHPNLVGCKAGCEDSGKFNALNELFDQLGFRDQVASTQNKAIIFSRSTSTIQLIEKLFMTSLYPKLRYLKLTSAIKPNERFIVAQNFNGDSDIKVLLVTTAVGGEGLNLSSANVVIMFDHDYNPTVDMQAIDRAHRIGQKRVLNVYRLITKNTLEERIMGIQKFKQNLAKAIVNIDNASIKNIQQSKLPQLLENIKDLEDQDQNKKKKEKIKQSFYNKLVEEMANGAIDEEEYDKEY